MRPAPSRLGPAVANILNFAAPPDYKIILVHNAFLFLVLMAAMSAIAVHWHRHLILDETPRLREIVSFDRTKLRYLWAFILVTIVPAGIAFAVGAAKTSIARDETEQLVGTALFLITIFPLCAILFMRLGTMLPAIAIGRRDVSPSVAWTATRGNSHTVLALFLLYLATLAAGHAASLAIGGVFSAFSYAVADWVFYWLRLAVNWFVTILAITIFTVLHRAFIEEPST